MEYYYYNITTGEFAFSKQTEISRDDIAYTLIAPPTCEHGDAYPLYTEKAIFDSVTETWTKVPI